MENGGGRVCRFLMACVRAYVGISDLETQTMVSLTTLKTYKLVVTDENLSADSHSRL